ncbi:hypothetical protein I545_2606 [Mycobacterium kansasii 662]|uniref:Uncharacterized protein n=4 Tax=Mycobacterium kansasii TaxID=1768 RepID=A0A1V3WN79_MYCKA|nr:hypothetical protein MKAN_04215 [Mycobacterium kansasii ATCC 12478]EUA18656.1 hypothetical protein I545_2606 [Mycobacterium kansasii 662]KEP40511.1 hypothetical protein MKSMC1_43380 [Mycobacterium kansasii]OOK68440.1 hypothetical protein BZL29_7028 [Mycobacterium kansasii]VAZ61482.1 hypothetical protein LAUMK22_03293 [Mycobacterium kansasii]
MFARVLGPFLAIVGAAVVARAPQMSTLLSEFEAVWAGVQPHSTSADSPDTG